MPFPFEAVAQVIWPLLGLALLVVCSVAATVFLVHKHRNTERGLPDAIFWDGFAGLAVVAPAVIVAALVSPWAGLLLGVVAAGTAVAAHRWTRRLLSRQEARRRSEAAAAHHAVLAERHRNAVARWQRYELDPAYCIDYPAMSDPRQPATAALLKAMRAAERLTDRPDTEYGPAVAALEAALARAERDAGVEAAGTGTTGALPAPDATRS